MVHTNSEIRKYRYKLGIFSEFLAIFILSINGYKIIKRRYKTNVGEIDIIASKRNILSFIEVKGRSKNIDLENIISSNQIKRIKNTASLYISKNKKYSTFELSFDLFIVERKIFTKHLINYL